MIAFQRDPQVVYSKTRNHSSSYRSAIDLFSGPARIRKACFDTRGRDPPAMGGFDRHKKTCPPSHVRVTKYRQADEVCDVEFLMKYYLAS